MALDLYGCEAVNKPRELAVLRSFTGAPLPYENSHLLEFNLNCKANTEKREQMKYTSRFVLDCD